MPTIEDSILIQAPQPELFDLAQDYALRLKWDPFLREVRFLDGATEPAVGVKVWVRAWNWLTMTVEYVSLNRPHIVAMKMLKGPFFFKQFAGSWRFEHRGDATQVIFRYVFESHWPWLQRLLDPVMSRVFRRDIRERLQGLKRGAEEQGLLTRLDTLNN